MVIGYDGSRAFSLNRTGTENYSYQLLKALAKIDKRNKYLVFVKNRVVTEEFPDNFHFITINWPKFWTQGGLGIQTFKDSLDLLFVPAHTLPIIRKPGLKTVVTVHDLGSEYLPSMHQLKQRAYLGLMQKYQLKGATKIIAVSNATKKDLVKRVGVDQKKMSKLSSSKIEVIYEGYDKNLFKPVSARGRSSFGRNSLKPYYLFVGTIQPRKNLERLIQAFSRIKTPSLVIVGQKGWLSEEIYVLPKKLGIEDRVKFLGYVPDEKLPALYSGAIALTFPSLFEGFGLPILEAQACGCPVITSNVSSMPEVAGKGAVYVNPASIEDIIRGMREIGPVLPRGRGIREKLIKAGFENIKRFSWEKCAKETLKVLEGL